MSATKPNANSARSDMVRCNGAADKGLGETEKTQDATFYLLLSAHPGNQILSLLNFPVGSSSLVTNILLQLQPAHVALPQGIPVSPVDIHTTFTGCCAGAQVSQEARVSRLEAQTNPSSRLQRLRSTGVVGSENRSGDKQ